jgi:hypothetical protein
MNAVDTNVLFYARDPRDPRKQRIASDLVASLTDGALLWQVACEFLFASRKLEQFGYLPAHAAKAGMVPPFALQGIYGGWRRSAESC